MKLYTVTALAVVLALALLAEQADAQGRDRRRRRGRRNRRIRMNRRRTTTSAPKPCPPIPHVTNGQGLDTGNTVQYACEPGYVLEGTNVITCLDGRWTVAPRCRRQLCPIPPNVPFANAPQLSNGGVTATYTCNTGYRIVGGNGATTHTIQCSTQTQFWPNLPTCEPIPVASCSGPPSITNAVSTVSNNIATYSCITGYRLKAGTPSRIVCNGGTWPSTGLPMCERDPTTNPEPTKCLKAPPCGNANINREAVGDSYTVGNAVKYMCNSGYRIVGSNNNVNNTANVYCKSDGTWTTTPTCEPVVCGVPTAGTNTKPVVTATISYPGTYLYACIDNYETSSSLETKCLADGKWSLQPAPTCIKKTCKGSTLKTLANADFLPNDVAIGGTVTYRCHSGYRLAPATPTSTASTQTVTCQADGTFTALASTCVYTYPESCRDYFTRDNLFASAATTCASVIIDPQGPNPADPNNPPAVTVQCCKTSATTFCTQVAPSAGSSASVSGAACTGGASTLMSTTTFTPATSATCDTPTSVTYPISNSQIVSMIRSTTGTCSQVTSISCTTAAAGTSLALRVNGQPSAFLYGTAIFDDTTAGTGEINLDNYVYAGATCDCATSGVAIAAGTTCASGCQCSTLAAVPAATADTITKYLTAENPQYVTGYQATVHNIAPNPNNPAANSFSATVGNINCCETF